MDWKTFIVLMSIIVGWVGLGCYRSWCQTQETIARMDAQTENIKSTLQHAVAIQNNANEQLARLIRGQ